MNKYTVFGSLDRGAEIKITEGKLPHWFQAGAAIFVTFRTADSLPKSVVTRQRRELTEWLVHNGLPTSLALSAWESHEKQNDEWKRIPTDKRTQYKKLADRIWHKSLDECHGTCILRNPDCSKIVGDAIRHFDSERYDLDRFVVMPNHVHAIVQFRQGWDLQLVSQSWMRFTARRINELNSTSGAIWQPEPFDHIIRSGNQFAYLQSYIDHNPRKALLNETDYLLWARP